MTFGFELIIIALMLVLNAVFASYEMALASISRARLATLSQQKKKGAEQAAYMKDRMEASLAVVQLGITFAGALAAATGGAGMQESFTPYLTNVLKIPDSYAEILAIICLVIPLSAFTIIFAELVPKMFALDNKEGVCLALSPMMKGIATIADPVVSFFETIVKKIMSMSAKKIKAETVDDKQGLHELRAAVAIARTSRLIGAHEEKIVLSAAQLSTRKVSDIMLQASDISTISLSSTLADALIKAHLDMHTRFPVYEQDNDPQTVVGYVNFKDIVNALKVNPEDPSLQGIMRPIKRVSAETPLSQVLSEMIHEKIHIAVVTSQDQKVVGMITLEDIMEELVGEIEDEFDRLPVHIHPYGTNWIIGGGVPMDIVFATVQKLIPAEGSKPQVPILAEWVSQKLGRPPEPGETAQLDGLMVTARKLRRKKLYEAVVAISK